MRVLPALLSLLLAHNSLGMDQLHVSYSWSVLDYAFPSAEARTQALTDGSFVPENNVPVGLDAAGSRLFLTVPRLLPGVPASLNYIELADNSSSPLLNPYPDWASHNLSSGAPALASPHRVRADRCHRLWVLDSGLVHTAGNVTQFPPKIVVYDLSTDKPLRTYEFPKDQLKNESNLINIAVEVIDCNNTFAYAVDSAGALVVYSWAEDRSWRFTHHFFNLSPEAGQYSIKGHNYTEEISLFGVALSAPKGNYSTMYFHPQNSFNEFTVSTEFLRNTSDANFDKFKLLGSRGLKAQASASFLDPKTGVLFNAMVNINAVTCWKTSNQVYEVNNQGRIFMSNELMVNPSDIKVDENDTLWVLSNKLPLFRFEKLNTSEVNFRVFSAPVAAAINYTACDTTHRPDFLKTVGKANTTIADATKDVVAPLNIVPSTNDTASEGKGNKPSSAVVSSAVSSVFVLLSTVSFINLLNL